MTKDEAMSRLLGLIYFLQDENLLTQDEVNDINQAYNILIQQPDAETGLMPCGCGGKVAIAKYPGFLDTPDLYQVDCFECCVGTKPTMSPERARIAWNKAMGYTDTLQGQNGCSLSEMRDRK